MAETVEVKASFRSAFRKRRCLVPADGFYEWGGSKQDRKPTWFHAQDGGILFFAGLYEPWSPRPNQTDITFTIRTCGPNAVTRSIHNRMPVILRDAKAQEDWINPRGAHLTSLKQLLIPVPDEFLAARHASSLVNSVQNEGPEL